MSDGRSIEQTNTKYVEIEEIETDQSTFFKSTGACMFMLDVSFIILNC